VAEGRAGSGVQVKALQRLRSAETYRLLEYYVNGGEKHLSDEVDENWSPAAMPEPAPRAPRKRRPRTLSSRQQDVLSPGLPPQNVTMQAVPA
jgi:hypothetical protein